MFSPFQAPPNYMAPPPFAQSFGPPSAPIPQQMIARGGGLFRRLFAGFSGAGRFGALNPSPLQSMNLMSMIENTQRVINIIQSVSPMIQQYGPLLRNIPTIYKMLKESPSTTTETEKMTKQNVAPSDQTANTTMKQPVQKTVPKYSTNLPAPKMYV